MDGRDSPRLGATLILEAVRMGEFASREEEYDARERLVTVRGDRIAQQASCFDAAWAIGDDSALPVEIAHHLPGMPRSDDMRRGFRHRLCTRVRIFKMLRIPPLWVATLAMSLSWGSSALAQVSMSRSTIGGSDLTRGYGISPMAGSFAGSPAYVPFGGSMGGFVPYSPGPGGGLGTQPGMTGVASTMPPPGSSTMGATTGLGLLRTQIMRLTPIGTNPMGSASINRMGTIGAPSRRPPSGGSMGVMPRPPVGGYPFRQPPSLIGPATGNPSMSM